MYQVGIVGCGGISQVHAAVLTQLPEVNLIACADIRMERAQAMAEKTGCHAYASLEEMLENEKLDAVHLCVPHYLHAPMALQIAQKGIAVFTEKPPIMIRSQWEMLKEAADLVPLGICFQNRYNPNVKEAERLLAKGCYGKLLGARAFVTWHREAPYYQDSGWRGTWATEGGGVLINQSIHTLDLLVRFIGPVSQVQAHMANDHLQNIIEVEDTVSARLIAGDRTALFYATTAYLCDSPVLIELQLEKAVLRLENDALDIITKEGRQTLTFSTPETLGKGYWGNGHGTCIADFYRSLHEHTPYQNDLASVKETADVMLRMYEQGKAQL